jgi:predicted aconitase with swiveling domain
MTARIEGRVLFPGTATGPLLKLSAPLSLWGGIDPATGTIIHGRHPERGRNVKGSVLAIPEPIGSSSSSYVMLELIHSGNAPAALLLGRADAIIVVGCLVAREMGWPAPPMVEMGVEQIKLIEGSEVRVRDGAIETN